MRPRRTWPLSGTIGRLVLPVALLAVGRPAAAQDLSSPAATIDARELSKVPRQVGFVEAPYPPEAVNAGLEADVVLLLSIGAEGQVTDVAIAEPSAHPGLGFEAAAAAAALGFRFAPAEMDGQPVAVQLTYRYKFRLAAAPVIPPETQSGSIAPSSPPAPSAASGQGRPAAAARPRPAPAVNYQGVLRERGTRLPLAGLMVTVYREHNGAPSGFETVSDAQGGFRFFDLAAGTWNVRVEGQGYQPFVTTEQILVGQATQVTYYVERSDEHPFDILVTAPKPRKEVSRVVLSAQEIGKVPGTAGDPLAVIQNLAGVARGPFLGGQIIVRGAAPEDSRVFVDAIEVPLIYHFFGLRSVLPLQILDSIEFYPGNFSPAYGRATGGVVDARIKDLRPERVGGSVDVSLLDAGLYLEIPLGQKGGLALAGRRSYVGTVLDAAMPDDTGFRLTVAPRYYDYQLLANYRPTPAHELRAFFFGSDDRLEFLFESPADFDPALGGDTLSSSETFQRGLFTYRFVPGTRFENQLQLSLGRDAENDFFGQLAVDIDMQTGHLRNSSRFAVAEALSLAGGLDLLVIRNDGFVNAPPIPKEGQPAVLDLGATRSTRFSETHWSPAAFIEADLTLFGHWLLLPGLRVDHFRRSGETVFEPRLTTRLALGERFTGKGGVGLFAQDPQPDETNPTFGNPDLRAERAMHVSVGAEYRPWSHLTLDATLFYKDLRNLVSPSETLVVGDGMWRPLQFDNRGRGRVMGGELVIRHDWHDRFAGWLAYTLSRSVRRDSGATEDRLFDFDQTHILTAVGTYAFARTWHIGARFRLVSGNPRTPIEGAVFNASADRYQAVYGRPNSARNAAFHQLDLRIEKRWVFERWMLNLYLDVQNVYNRANPEGVVYNYDYRESKVQQGLPIFPILGLRADL